MSVRKNIRILEKEEALLKAYCQQEERSETDVIRELIRSIEERLTPESKRLLGNVSKDVTVG